MISALEQLRRRHATLSSMDKESEQEEEELASELQQLLLASEALVGDVAGLESEDDHVPVDLTESNLRLPGGAGPVAKGQSVAVGALAGVKAPPVTHPSSDEGNNSMGAMVACPRVDLI